MLESIRLQLERLGINVQKDIEFQFERDGSTIRIPGETYGFVSSMENSTKAFYFDRWDDGLDSLYIMNTALASDCIEYKCLEKHPYFSFMSNHSHSYYVIRADDKNPANPAVYYIDHDDFDAEEAYLVEEHFSEFLVKLMTREEVNLLLEEDDEYKIKDIEQLLNS